MIKKPESIREFSRGQWEVPLFDQLMWQGRKTKYCVVIPVINEGSRIRNLLSKMAVLGIHETADIIIIDGGSTDGSLDTNYLAGKHIAGLLLKRGPGKLSAQLRCAYAFALDQGYAGIVTIDGNDKDDPGAIKQFIEHLDRGWDFIQGSRFVGGGVAVNTPRSRDLAIRFIHAPMLSLFSGFRWTDTTQGFRGYSRKMLLDEQVAPFRSQFMTYELLAYLSYRAPRLEYRCVEIPTSRIYPVGEVPTKISGFKGNLAVLQVLIRACLGRYDPKAAMGPMNG
jgi:dolichol-phosphate mannosyltransferase